MDADLKESRAGAQIQPPEVVRFILESRRGLMVSDDDWLASVPGLQSGSLLEIELEIAMQRMQIIIWRLTIILRIMMIIMMMKIVTIKMNN